MKRPLLALARVGSALVLWAGMLVTCFAQPFEAGKATIRFVNDPEPVPGFTLKTVDGRILQSDEWQGKVVSLNFWATWCPPCLDEIPNLIRLQSKYADRLQIVGLSLDIGPQESVNALLQNFVAQRGINYPVAIASPELQAKFGGILGLPTAFLLDKHGQVVQKHVGVVDPKLYEAEIRALLGLSVDAKIERLQDTGQGFPSDVKRTQQPPAVRSDPSSAVRRFEFTYAARFPHIPADSGEVRAWIPLPPTDTQQAISDLRIESPVPFKIHRESEYGNEYVYLDVPAKTLPQELEIQIHFRVERHEHRVALNLAFSNVRPGTPTTNPEVSRALAPDRLIPITGAIESLSEQETRGLRTPLEKARAIYDYVVATMRYDKTGQGWGRGDALFASNTKRGNCTDFHSLFIGMMRAAHIPARFEIGFPIPTDKTEGPVAGYHCWAEFYIDPAGWIPVDSSEAWQKPARRDYFFGANDENRVLFTVGRDIRLNPPQDGQPLNFFIYPYVEVGGKQFEGVKYQFVFRDLPAPSVSTLQGGEGSLR